MKSSHHGPLERARRMTPVMEAGRFSFITLLIIATLMLAIPRSVTAAETAGSKSGVASWSIAHPFLAAGPPGAPALPRENIRPQLSPNIIPQKPPWGAILIATLVLAGIAYLVTRYVVGEGRGGSGRRSRGGWVLDSSGVGQISGGSSDDEVSGGSRNFLGGGAGGNW